MTFRILNLEPEAYSPQAYTILQGFAETDNGPLTRAELLDNIAKYHGLIVRLGHRIDAAVLARATKLRVIVTATTGLNHIDTDAATQKGITILSLRGETDFLNSVSATAEHSFALLLALIRKLPAATKHVTTGQWQRDLFKGRELAGKTLGIYGYGRLGRKVARYGAAFGMHVLAHDITDFAPESGVTPVTRDALLAQSDILSLHVLYTPQNHHLLDASAIAQMKPGSLLINTARGELVDEDVLLSALTSGHLAGAALDVVQGENSGNDAWMAQDRLIAYAKTHDNLLITPHIGGATIDSMANTEIFMARKLQAFLF